MDARHKSILERMGVALLAALLLWGLWQGYGILLYGSAGHVH